MIANVNPSFIRGVKLSLGHVPRMHHTFRLARVVLNYFFSQHQLFPLLYATLIMATLTKDVDTAAHAGIQDHL